MRNVKKILTTAAIIVGVLVMDVIAQNCINFCIPDTILSMCSAMIGIGLYETFLKKISKLH